MRGGDEIWGSLFSYIGLEKRVRADHPLRAIREIPNAALAALTGEFARARLDPAGAADAGAAAAGLFRSERQLGGLITICC